MHDQLVSIIVQRFFNVTQYQLCYFKQEINIKEKGKIMVTQIANRLVRTFGSGANLKKIVTEVIDGKTFTTVFDKEGSKIRTRVKAFADEVVGDKLVKTKKNVVQQRDCEPEKYIIDRVYSIADDTKTLIGKRRTAYSTVDGTLIKTGKGVVNKDSGKEVYTYYGDNGTRLRKDYYSDGLLHDGYIQMNSLGLPYPNGRVVDELFESPLSDMRIHHFNNKPGEKYLPDWCNMPSLDDVSGLGVKLNYLDNLL